MSRMYNRVYLRANYESVSNCSGCVILHCAWFLLRVDIFDVGRVV